MSKVLSYDILKDDSVVYSDNLKYVEGENIYFGGNAPDITTPYTNENEYSRYIVEKLGQMEEISSPELVYEDIQLSVDTMSDIASQVSHITIEMSWDTLRDFEHIFIDEDHDDDLETMNICKNDRYDCVNYYAVTDTLAIPRPIYNYIKNGNVITTKIAVYNIDRKKVNHKIFNGIKPVNIPELNFHYIPSTIKCAKFDGVTGSAIHAPSEYMYSDRFYVYVNLPKEIYDKCIIDSRLIAYDTAEKLFYGRGNVNQTKLNVLCKDIAQNGIKSAIQFKLIDCDKLMPYYSTRRFVAAKYLGLPSIPACIIYDFNEQLKHEWTHKPIIGKHILNDLMKPYIMMNM